MAQETYVLAAKGYLTREQLAAETGMKEDTLFRWEQAGMPAIKYGQLTLYEIDVVIGWMKKNQNKK